MDAAQVKTRAKTCKGLMIPPTVPYLLKIPTVPRYIRTARQKREGCYSSVLGFKTLKFERP